MVSYTTLGYRDIVLEQKYHVLSSVEAANSIIIHHVRLDDPYGHSKRAKALPA